MSGSPYKKAVDEIQAGLKPFFKQHGFRVRGRTFNRKTSDGLTQIVGIQMGRFDPPGTVHIPDMREDMYGQFTVELEVFVPELHWDPKPMVWVHFGYGHLSARLGQLCGEEEDLWWKAQPGEAVLTDLLLRLNSAGLPYLERFDTRDKWIASWTGKPAKIWGSEPRPQQVAILLAHRGERERSREILRAEYLESNDQQRKDLLELVAELGLGPIDR
jgi:Domain of unknown function (DUF4304)